MTRTARIPVSAAQRLIILAAVVSLACLGLSTAAVAVTTTGRMLTTVAPPGELATATYTFISYKTARNEYCTGFTIVFPAGTDASGATCPNGTVSVISSTTVTVTFTPRIGGVKATTIPVSLQNVRNPLAMAVPEGTITFHRTDLAGNPLSDQALERAPYDIVATPYVALTITTPDPAQTVDFGPVDPGTPSAAENVVVEVSASGDCTIARDITGQDALMGLTVIGDAVGVKPAGSGVYTDSYQVNPPWTTGPGAYAATVRYTVTLQ